MKDLETCILEAISDQGQSLDALQAMGLHPYTEHADIWQPAVVDLLNKRELPPTHQSLATLRNLVDGWQPHPNDGLKKFLKVQLAAVINDLEKSHALPEAVKVATPTAATK